ncbi:MAG TPA: hypothetical protein GX707_20675 [Epulopiscium sp.]|nr:hypothetical protein [Candidatus Epulonipiscium sp.]
MRKVIAVLMMIFVVVFFYSSLQKRQPESKKKKEIIEVIADLNDQVEKKYPDNPIEIIEIHNEIINMLYGKELTEEETTQAVEVQRKLYAEEFLALNPIEKHMLEIARETVMNGEKEIKIIGSKVMNSYNDPPGTMRVQVVHYTNKQDQDLVREYIVKEENSPSSEKKKWKIFGWENIGVAKTQEEKE